MTLSIRVGNINFPFPFSTVRKITYIVAPVFLQETDKVIESGLLDTKVQQCKANTFYARDVSDFIYEMLLQTKK